MQLTRPTVTHFPLPVTPQSTVPLKCRTVWFSPLAVSPYPPICTVHTPQQSFCLQQRGECYPMFLRRRLTALGRGGALAPRRRLGGRFGRLGAQSGRFSKAEGERFGRLGVALGTL